ncbi:hypothetical protein E2C01_064268 [Portunus trituberculatus]|uniref:Uncharacterized protein n=1 Tax=Portunus trituberculatus TaxID=210409 RepID=A0A5B7HIL8_PORTR|nr:hypothetical protein [Portunus trituberculatus]
MPLVATLGADLIFSTFGAFSQHCKAIKCGENPTDFNVISTQNFDELKGRLTL